MSYASENRDAVRLLVSALTSEGFSVWWDRDIEPGVLDPERLQRRTFAAVRALVHADGQREKPAIVYFEDLHWLDAASDAYLAQIITADTRGLVLVNFRPEYRADWMQSPSYQQLPLVSLGAEAVGDLLANWLGTHPSVVGLASFVHQRADGNPFFVEEIVQTLIETGSLEGERGAFRLVRPATELALPASVVALLAARIDRLPEREKRLLEQATVIGRTFPERVLARISGLSDAELHTALRTLVDAQFLYEESVYPHAAYSFKHPLTQEVADRSQLSDRRAATHADVARVVEDLSASHLDEEAALLAHHWAAAGEDLVAARWHARAARWIGVSNFTEAYAHWRRVLALVAESEHDVDVMGLRLEAQCTILMLAFRVGISEHEAAAIFATGRREAQRLGADAPLAALIIAYSALRQGAGAMDEYLALAEEAEQIARRSGDRASYATAGLEHAFALCQKGRLQESHAVSQDTRARCDGDASFGVAVQGYSVYVMSYLVAAMGLTAMGRLREATQNASRGIELAEQHGPDESRAWPYGFASDVACAKGLGADCIELARVAARMAEPVGNQWLLPWTQLLLSGACSLNRRWDLAVEHAEGAVRVWRTQGICGDFAPLFLAAHSRALLGKGEVRTARELSAEAVALAQQQGEPVSECEATLVHVACLRAHAGTGAPDAIETSLAHVLQLIEQTGAERWRPQIHIERAELDRLVGDTDAAQREFREAHRLFIEMDATGHAARIAHEITL